MTNVWCRLVLKMLNWKCRGTHTCKYTHLQPSALLSVIHGQWSNLLHQLCLWVKVTESFILPAGIINLPRNFALLHTLGKLGFTVASLLLKASAQFVITLHATAVFLAQLSWTPVSLSRWEWTGEQSLRRPRPGGRYCAKFKALSKGKCQDVAVCIR